MNLRVSEHFGENVARLPLKKSATIGGNALRDRLNDVVPAVELATSWGNPPFIGHRWRDADQMANMAASGARKGGSGLDYVTAWYRLAVDYMQGNPAIHVSALYQSLISSGEHYILWVDLLVGGVRLHFGHRALFQDK